MSQDSHIKSSFDIYKVQCDVTAGRKMMKTIKTETSVT